MTRDDIIRMAREAGLYTILNEHAHEYGNGYFENTPYPELERFAALVAAAELKRVADVIRSDKYGIGNMFSQWTSDDVADDILKGQA
jgi:hypothetical protein